MMRLPMNHQVIPGIDPSLASLKELAFRERIVIVDDVATDLSGNL